MNAANESSGVADTINLDLNQLADITLASTSQLPAITDPAGLTIDGSSVNITISGGEQHRVFWVDRGAKLTLNRLTVANGLVPLEGTATAGGSIYCEGALQVSNSTISGNSADIGGGIFYDTRTTGSAKIWNTTISGNSVDPDGEGSGIFHGSEVTMWNTMVANNLGRASTSASVRNVASESVSLPLGGFEIPEPTLPEAGRTSSGTVAAAFGSPGEGPATWEPCKNRERE